MKIQILLFSLFSNEVLAVSDTETLNFSNKAKREIETTFNEGQLRFEYDEKKNLINKYRHKNISAADMAAYMNAYNTAHDLERKIRLSNELKKRQYIYTDFSEHFGPHLPKEIPLRP